MIWDGGKRVWVSLYWIPPEVDSSIESLVDAFEAFVSEQYRHAIVPANGAIESHIGRFFSRLVREELGLNPDGFLKDGATYGHQLKVLLPLVASLAKAPPLDRRAHDALKHLRKLRNDVAHNSPSSLDIRREDLAKMLTAAVLGFAYIDLLEERLLGQPSTGARTS